MASSVSTITLRPAGASNFDIDICHSTGTLASGLATRPYWQRQALVEEALGLGWSFVRQHEVEEGGGAIALIVTP
jgi:hypothetical protein